MEITVRDNEWRCPWVEEIFPMGFGEPACKSPKREMGPTRMRDNSCAHYCYSEHYQNCPFYASARPET